MIKKLFLLFIILSVGFSQVCSLDGGCARYQPYSCNCRQEIEKYDCSYYSCFTEYHFCNCRTECKEYKKVCTRRCFFFFCWNDCKQQCTYSESVCEMCGKRTCATLHKTCERNVEKCDTCFYCAERKKDIIYCPDDYYRCNGDTLEFVDYRCDRQCSYVINSQKCANGCYNGKCLSRKYDKYPEGFNPSFKLISKVIQPGKELRVELTYSSNTDGYVYFPIDLIKDGTVYVCGNKDEDPRNCQNEVVLKTYITPCQNCKKVLYFDIPSNIPLGKYKLYIGYRVGSNGRIYDEYGFKGSWGPAYIDAVNCYINNQICYDDDVYLRQGYYDGVQCTYMLNKIKDCQENLGPCETGYCDAGVCQINKKNCDCLLNINSVKLCDGVCKPKVGDTIKLDVNVSSKCQLVGNVRMIYNDKIIYDGLVKPSISENIFVEDEINNIKIIAINKYGSTKKAFTFFAEQTNKELPSQYPFVYNRGDVVAKFIDGIASLYNTFVSDELSQEIFMGLSGLEDGQLSTMINNFKFIAGFVELGLGVLSMFFPVLIPVAIAFSIADNTLDVIETGLNLVGMIGAYKAGDINLAKAFLIGFAIGIITLAPLGIGDILGKIFSKIFRKPINYFKRTGTRLYTKTKRLFKELFNKDKYKDYKLLLKKREILENTPQEIKVKKYISFCEKNNYKLKDLFEKRSVHEIWELIKDSLSKEKYSMVAYIVTQNKDNDDLAKLLIKKILSLDEEKISEKVIDEALIKEAWDALNSKNKYNQKYLIKIIDELGLPTYDNVKGFISMCKHIRKIKNLVFQMGKDSIKKLTYKKLGTWAQAYDIGMRALEELEEKFNKKFERPNRVILTDNGFSALDNEKNEIIFNLLSIDDGDELYATTIHEILHEVTKEKDLVMRLKLVNTDKIYDKIRSKIRGNGYREVLDKESEPPYDLLKNEIHDLLVRKLALMTKIVDKTKFIKGFEKKMYLFEKVLPEIEKNLVNKKKKYSFFDNIFRNGYIANRDYVIRYKYDPVVPLAECLFLDKYKPRVKKILEEFDKDPRLKKYAEAVRQVKKVYDEILKMDEFWDDKIIEKIIGNSNKYKLKFDYSSLLNKEFKEKMPKEYDNAVNVLVDELTGNKRQWNQIKKDLFKWKNP